MTSRVWSWSIGSALAAFALVLGVSALTPGAMAYSASQAEAQTDPSNDPYNFPGIEVCCKPHFPPPRCGHHRHGDDDGPYDDDDRGCRGDGRWGRGHGGHGGHDGGLEAVDVDCGAKPGRRFATSIQEALDLVRPGGTIRIRSAFPGPGCVGNVVITKSVTILGVGENDQGGLAPYNGPPPGPPGSGRPITAIVDGCISIWGQGRPRVVMRDIEILGTTSGYVKDCNPTPTFNVGTTGLTPPRARSGENLFTALMVDGATFFGNNVSVRSAGRAFYAEHSVVDLTGGNFAAHPAYDAADAAVWLLRTQADFRGVSIAGGRDGVMISMLDRYPVNFDNVSILPVRTQVGGVYPEDGRLYRGKTGIHIKLDYEDLPSTADHDLAGFRWTGGTVHGYRQGIDVGPGVNAKITGVNVVDTLRAAHFTRGAQVAFETNKISGNHDVAIQIDPGAVGHAGGNDITCAHGECICYGEECNGRGDVDAGGFVIEGNVCRAGGRAHDYEDVGGNDW